MVSKRRISISQAIFLAEVIAFSAILIMAHQGWFSRFPQLRTDYLVLAMGALFLVTWKLLSRFRRPIEDENLGPLKDWKRLCPNCGTDLPTGARTCPSCGETIMRIGM